MSKSRNNTLKNWSLVVFGLILALGCSTDSPTAPAQTPAPPPGTDVSAIWNITVTTDVRQAAAGATEPINIEVRVRRADNGDNPPNGTTIVISTTLGEFSAIGSGLTAIATSLSNGRGSALLFPGVIEGSAVITAQLESSAGQRSVQIRAGLVAAFDFVNSNNNLSVQFRDLSLGDPNRYNWEFGDGQTSTEQHPSHLYSTSGDYVVTLSITKGELSDRTTTSVGVVEPLFITDIDPDIGSSGTDVVIKGTGFFPPLRVIFANALTDVYSVSSDRKRISATVPIIATADYATADCSLDDGMGGTTTGQIIVSTLIPVTVESINGNSDTVAQAYIIVPINPVCESTGS